MEGIFKITIEMICVSLMQTTKDIAMGSCKLLFFFINIYFWGEIFSNYLYPQVSVYDG